MNGPVRRTRFYLLLSLLLALIIVRYGLQVELPKAVFLAVIVFAALLGDSSEVIALCMCCIPLHEAVDFFYSVVLCTAVYLVKNYRHIRLNVSVVFPLAMVLWELLHCLGASFSVLTFITNIAPLLVLTILMGTDVRKLDYDFIARALTYATFGICTALFTRVLMWSGFDIAAAAAGLQRLGVSTGENSISGGSVNPNSLGILCVLAITALMQLRQAGRGTKGDLAAACTIMLFGALTSSRTYLICLLLMFVLLVMSQRGALEKKLKFLLLAAFLGLLAVGLLYLLFPDLLEYYISRFFEDDLTTGRDDLMTLYHEFIVSNPRVLLFGIGLQDLGEKLTEVHRVAFNVPHNALQELVAAWGLPGVILLGGMLVVMIPNARALCPKQGLINLIPLIIIIVKSMAGQLLDSPYTMLALSFAYLSLCADLTAQKKTVYEPDPGCNIKFQRRNTIT